MEAKRGWTKVPMEVYKCKFSNRGDCLYTGRLPSGASYSSILKCRFCNVPSSNSPDPIRQRCNVAAQGDNVIKEADIVAHISPGGSWA